MPLTFDVSQIENHQTLTTDPDDPDQWHPLTKYLLNSTMRIYMSGISEANASEFFARLYITEKMYPNERRHSVVDGVVVDIDTTWEDVKSHIGLKTNTPTKSHAEWWKFTREDIQGE